MLHFFFAIISLWCGLATAESKQLEVPHWDLEMTSEEYRSLLDSSPGSITDDPALDKALKLGARALDWLKHINGFRPEETKLSLSSPETQQGYPIETAGTNSPAIIKKLLSDFEAEAPDWFLAVVFKGGAFTNEPPTSDEEYISWGLRFNRIYQKASRWTLQEPWLFAYTSRRSGDVRGYYYLQKEKNLEQTLAEFGNLSSERQSEISGWMVGLCFNSAASIEGCKKEWNAAIAKKQPLLAFYSKYLSGGKNTWNRYYALQGKRRDVTWTSANPNLMSVPFQKPDTLEVQDFLKDNIEDEWKFGDWALKLDFIHSTSGTTHVVFEAGATPNVNGLGGNTITMDANQPLTEYNVQWTIRHEYGHTLGLPDCYVEFYETETSTMVNYQLDITDIMCSRKGHIKQLHHDELKKAYFK